MRRRLPALFLLLGVLLAGLHAAWQAQNSPRDSLRPADSLAERGFALGQPVHLRVFKEDNRLELWMERDGRFALAATYPVCAWSGSLGPKLKEGDRQAPEGFYLVSRRQLKPDSTFHRALNLGFPNAFDVAQGRTGSFLMIHGACVSVGCYAMTDAVIEEIYTAVEAALANGQDAVPVHIFPFRMTEDRLAAASAEAWSPFWRNLAEGDRLFRETGRPPRAYACGTRYGFAAGDDASPAGCAPIEPW